jgi:hypothetical protein
VPKNGQLSFFQARFGCSFISEMERNVKPDLFSLLPLDSKGAAAVALTFHPPMISMASVRQA